MKFKTIRANPPLPCAVSPSICAVLRFVLAFSLAASAHLSAATVRTWTGGSATSGNWSTAANWAGGAPVAGDILNFVDTGARKTSNTNNFAAGTTFSTINCFGNGYRLRGNRVTITNQVGVGNPAGAHIIDLDLTLGGPVTSIDLVSFAAAARLTVNGDIDLGAHTLQAEGPGDYTVAGVISGAGGIFKSNTGDLSLSGLGANTFTGSTVAAAGVLRLNRYTLSGLNQVGTVAIPGDLSIGGFSSTLIDDLVVLDNNNQIGNTSTVSVLPTGALVLGAENDTLGELRLSGGTVSTTTGSLGVAGGIFASMPILVSKDSLIAGRLTLGARGAGPQIIDVAAGVQLNITAQISGVTTADLIKTNRGELVLSASNVFGGDVEIVGGTLAVSDEHAFGATNGITRLSLGAIVLHETGVAGEILNVLGPGAQLTVDSFGGSWNGSVILNDDLVVNVPTNRSVSITGQISGPAGWIKTGPGNLVFRTAYTHTYTGAGQVRQGDFVMENVFSQVVVPGPLIIGDGVGGPGADEVRNLFGHGVSDTSPVTVNDSGLWSMAFHSDTIGSLTFNGGGAVETGTGTLTLNGDILAKAGEDTAFISGNLSLGGATRTIYTLGTSNTPDLLISAAISDGGAAAGFNKIGEGSLELVGANTFTGPVSVTDGNLRLANVNALGSILSGTTVSGIDGARISLHALAGGNTINEPLTLDRTSAGSLPVLENATGTYHWDGPIALLASESVVNVPNLFRTFSLGGAISGPGGLKKVGGGQLTLDGATTNTFTGLTVVAEGELILDKPGDNEALHGDATIGDGIGGENADRLRIRGGGSEIWNGSRVVINGTGQLLLEGVLDLIGSIEGSGNISVVNGPGTAGLIVGRNDLSTTFSGVISGDGNFHKTGLGTLRLTGIHSYTGPTQLDEGRLEIEGSIASSLHLLLTKNASAPVFLDRFGTLGGSGVVPRLINWSGEVSPGVDLPTSAARINVQGNLELSNGVFRVQLNGTTPGAQYDQLRVTGEVNLGANAPSILLLATGFPPTTNDTFVIVDNVGPGPVVGTFNNLPDGAVLGSGFNRYQIRYTGGDGNDVTLRRVEISGSNITGIVASTSEKMHITGQGWPFVTYVLEATLHLNSPIPWAPIATNNANALGLYEFIDAYADNGMSLYPARFYRVVTP